jgi:geranyl-CoA carboxylase alpha subunit
MRFHTVLIANRGEIARRVIRTCHARGLTTVAVFTDVDAQAPFVREADRAVRIGAPTAYLDGAAVLAAAAQTGADAIHPGYGFLAENASFATAVQAAGLVWIGPSPAAMRALGDKSAARALARQIGVPTLNGYDGDDRAAMREAAVRIGFPVLIKAAAGGGGRGMRRVDDVDALDEALAAAEREAVASFGDGRLLLERLVLRPRHIEVQIVGDHHGNVIHLGERECSLQRRHQKVVEEAPAVDAALRERLGDAAIALARAARYDNAGTVEFLVDAHGQFTLLELNARLQVEHPVTETITGLDLVALQLDVAAGHPLPLTQADVRFVGHAIEVRICAEDPARDFAPATGTLVRVDLPDDLRVDTGVEAGSVVSPHYDSMLAKLIVYGIDRDEAILRMRRALAQFTIEGIGTTLPFLRHAIPHPDFVSGRVNTALVGRMIDEMNGAVPAHAG